MLHCDKHILLLVRLEVLDLLIVRGGGTTEPSEAASTIPSCSSFQECKLNSYKLLEFPRACVIHTHL